MTCRVSLLAAALLLLLPISAAAQSIAHYDQQVFAPGVSPATGAPQWTNTYSAAAAVCGQPAVPMPTTAVVNPTRLVFDDPAAPGKACVITLASTLLAALPNQVGYVSTLTQTDDLGQTSARSAASNPFSKQGPPAVLTGIKVVP